MIRLLLAAPLVAATQNSGIDKVIQLLGNLKGKVQNDLDNESKAMEEYTEFCDDEVTQKKFNIKTASSKIEEYSAIIEESDGKITDLQSQIGKDGQETAAKQTELADATKVRGDEKKDFDAAEKELVDTVDTLARAAAVLKRELSFAQGGSVSSKKLGNMVAALSAIVDASSSKSAPVVKAFLESEEDFSLTQPQASTKNYESKSGGIVAAIQDMQDKAEEELQGLRRDEMKSKHNFEMIAQSLSDAVTNLNKQVKESQSSLATTEENKAQAEEDLARTQASKSADEKYLSKMQRECQAKAQDWEVRQADATAEMAALDKANEVLSTGVTVLMQTGVKRTTVKAAGFETRDELVRNLKKMGRTFNSFALMQMSQAAKSDPFVKIRGMIEEMINKLEKQAADEATQEAFCQEENAKSAKKREQVTAEVDKYSTRMEKAKAGTQQLTDEISDLSAEIAEMNKSQAKATALRTSEKKTNTATIKDNKESAAAVGQAIKVLSDFYSGEGAAFVQQPSFGGRRNDASSTIISILETAQEDFIKLQTETEAEESESADAYDQLIQDNKVSLATKNAAIAGKKSEKKSLEVAITNTQEDLTNANNELDAVMAYIEKLKPQCENKAMSYAERKARREAEIKGLNSALELLAGDAAFVQTKAFLSRK